MSKFVFAAMLCASLLGCKSEQNVDTKTANVIDTRFIADPNSYAQTDKVQIEHIRLDLTVNMQQRILKGSADLTVRWLDSKATQLVLDTRDLQITSIQGGNGKNWQKLSFTLDAANPIYGSALRIAMPKPFERVRIFYQTSPEASGLQWLTSEMTSSKQP